MTHSQRQSQFSAIDSAINLHNLNIPTIFPNLSKQGSYVLKKTTNVHEFNQPKKIAVCFSGGPAPGGHSVVASIARSCSNKHTLLGITNGPKGLLNNEFSILDPNYVQQFNHTGGFHLLGTDRTKLTTQDQFNTIKSHVISHQLDGLILIGGDDTHTNAVFLAEALYDTGCSVIGVPKTIDGDLRYEPYLPLPFGFSTAVELYSTLVQNIILDTKSTKKYWHFIKLMGRTTSHITQKVGKNTTPDICIISEELATKSLTLPQLISDITTKIQEDYMSQKNYGVICFAEGILEFLPDITALISQLNTLIASTNKLSIIDQLSLKNKTTFKQLPEYIQHQLLLDRDSHGNINLSRINTQQLLIDLCQKELITKYSNTKVDCIPHFYGYEARCHVPNNYDQKLCAELGIIAFDLVNNKYTGYMAAYSPLDYTKAHYAIPILAMLEQQARAGKSQLVVKKALVT